MSIKKQYLKSKPVCKVTFSIPKTAVGTAKSVHVVGEFNNWDRTASPNSKKRNGDFTLTLKLEKDKEYQFRYLIDRRLWENDSNADKYIPSPYPDADNSVVIV